MHLTFPTNFSQQCHYNIHHSLCIQYLRLSYRSHRNQWYWEIYCNNISFLRPTQLYWNAIYYVINTYVKNGTIFRRHILTCTWRGFPFFGVVIPCNMPTLPNFPWSERDCRFFLCQRCSMINIWRITYKMSERVNFIELLHYLISQKYGIVNNNCTSQKTRCFPLSRWHVTLHLIGRHYLRID